MGEAENCHREDRAPAPEFTDSNPRPHHLGENGDMIPIGDAAPPTCSQCGRRHVDVEQVLGASAPDDWLTLSRGERLEAELTPDICIFTDSGRTRHFVRGHVQLPLVEGGDPPVFVWSVWVELDESSMELVARSWSNPNRAAIPPIEGRLANELPYEQPTRGLGITVHTRDPGMAPLLMVSEEHTLAAEQREGISIHRLAQLGARLQRQ